MKIKYSRKSDTDVDGTKVTVNISMANRSQFKIYTKENAEQIISSITQRLLGFNDGTRGVIKHNNKKCNKKGKWLKKAISLKLFICRLGVRHRRRFFRRHRLRESRFLKI